ncbi:endocuticle structural glycoprotein SgAbd-3 [Sergentomyia squamirostris]
MKTVLVVLALVGCALAAPQVLPAETPKAKDYKEVPILREENVVDFDGKYHYAFELGDGTKAEQDGELKQVDPENAGESVKGFYSYTGDDGVVYSVSYVADENGYVPVGDHLPQAPPIPEAIQRALAYLATAKPPTDEKKF